MPIRLHTRRLQQRRSMQSITGGSCRSSEASGAGDGVTRQSPRSNRSRLSCSTGPAGWSGDRCQSLTHAQQLRYFTTIRQQMSIDNDSFTVFMYMYSVSRKNPPCGFLKFFPNGWEFLINFYTPITRSFLH